MKQEIVLHNGDVHVGTQGTKHSSGIVTIKVSRKGGPSRKRHIPLSRVKEMRNLPTAPV